MQHSTIISLLVLRGVPVNSEGAGSSSLWLSDDILAAFTFQVNRRNARSYDPNRQSTHATHLSRIRTPYPPRTYGYPADALQHTYLNIQTITCTRTHASACRSCTRPGCRRCPQWSRRSAPNWTKTCCPAHRSGTQHRTVGVHRGHKGMSFGVGSMGDATVVGPMCDSG